MEQPESIGINSRSRSEVCYCFELGLKRAAHTHSRSPPWPWFNPRSLWLQVNRWSEPTPAIQSEGVVKGHYHKATPLAVRLESVVYWLPIRLFTDRVILAWPGLAWFWIQSFKERGPPPKTTLSICVISYCPQNARLPGESHNQLRFMRVRFTHKIVIRLLWFVVGQEEDRRCHSWKTEVHNHQVELMRLVSLV